MAKFARFCPRRKPSDALYAILGRFLAIFKSVDKLLKNFKIPPIFSILGPFLTTRHRFISYA